MKRAFDKKEAYDIVFWGHGPIEIDRFIPVMVDLEKKGLKTMLFFMNYKYQNLLPDYQIELINRHKIKVLDYSDFLINPVLSIAWIISAYIKKGRKTYIGNKLKGLCSILLKKYMTRPFIRHLLEDISPKVNVFDNITINTYTDYPYGSFFLRDISREMGIKCLSIHQAGTGHVMSKIDENILNFDRYYVPNEYEKNKCEKENTCSGAEVLVFGDPRFDAVWKKEISELALPPAVQLFCDNSKNILYLCPNLEHVSKKSLKYNNLENVVNICKSREDIRLFIKPHPRYRGEKEISDLMDKLRFSNFRVLDDMPIIVYADSMDLVISSATSALHDILPEGYSKVVIYDDFSDKAGIVNIFEEVFPFFDDHIELKKYILDNISGIDDKYKDTLHNEKIEKFCRKWVAGEQELSGIAGRIADDIVEQISGDAR